MTSTDNAFFRPFICTKCNISRQSRFMSQLSLRAHLMEVHGLADPRHMPAYRPPSVGSQPYLRVSSLHSGGRDSDSLSDEVFSDGYFESKGMRSNRSPLRVSPAQRTLQRKRRQMQQSASRYPQDPRSAQIPARHALLNRMKDPMVTSQPDLEKLKKYDDYPTYPGNRMTESQYSRPHTPLSADPRRPWYSNPDYRGPRPASASRASRALSPADRNDRFFGSSKSLNRVDPYEESFDDEKLMEIDKKMLMLSLERQKLTNSTRSLIRDGKNPDIFSESPRRFQDDEKEQQWNYAIKLLQDVNASPPEINTTPRNSSRFDDYVRQLHHRTTNAEQEAYSLRDALRSGSNQRRSSSNNYLEDDVEEDIIQPVLVKKTSTPRTYKISDGYPSDASSNKSNFDTFEPVNNKPYPPNESKNNLWPDINNSYNRPWSVPPNLGKKLGKHSKLSIGSSNTDDDERSVGSSSLSCRSPKPILPPSPAAELQRRCDALFLIFQYLDTKSLALVARVCREWYHVSRQPRLWKNVRISRSRISPGGLVQITKWCTEVENFALETIRPPQNANLGQKYDSSSYEASIEKFLKCNSQKLKNVKFVDCGSLLTERALWLTSVHCPKLEGLIYISNTDPVGSEVLWALGKGCPNIIRCVVAPGWPNEKPNKFSDRCVEVIAKNWPRLQLVCIGGRNLTEKALLALSISCPKLRMLEIDHGPEITENLAIKLVKVGFRGLERLDFLFTPVTPRAIVQFNSACPKLKVITIHGGIADYYEKKEDPKCQSDFVAVVNLFKKLQNRPGFKEVLSVKLDY